MVLAFYELHYVYFDGGWLRTKGISSSKSFYTQKCASVLYTYATKLQYTVYAKHHKHTHTHHAHDVTQCAKESVYLPFSDNVYRFVLASIKFEENLHVSTYMHTSTWSIRQFI